MRILSRIILLVSFLILLIFCVQAVNEIQCFFLESTSCPSGSIKLFGVKNDSGGANNSHAQNYTLGTYPYSLCCNNTNDTIKINNSCDQAIVVKLSAETDAHVEVGSNSNYSIPACLNSSYKVVSCNYPASACDAGYDCLFSMASSEGDNRSNAHVGDCGYYSTNVCCGLSNTAPSSSTLIYPADDNQSVFERTPNFNWTTSSDPEGDAITYTLNISCGDSCGASCADVDISDISDSNYTVSSALCVDELYNWSVYACDSYNECSSPSSTFNFTIASVQEILFIINTTGFGSMITGENNDTTDDDPLPLVARNTGNVLVNVSVNATALFDDTAMNTIYYRFKADEYEAGSYDAGCTQTLLTNMDVNMKLLFCNLSYVDANDEAELELSVTIPSGEGSGTKSSSILISTTATEP